MKTRIALTLVGLSVIAAIAAACSTDAGRSSGSPTPTATPTQTPTPTPVAPSPAPTPTPIAADVASPEDAAALVIATDPRFEGAVSLTSDIIGASKWWEAEALGGGAYRITLTLGWGDCPAGCINRHAWAFEVTGDGQVTLLEESGVPMPEGDQPE
ncbi:MAG: hypothetical protein AB1736_10425 [Chloroflexota bacterium]